MADPVQFASTFTEQAQVSVRGATSYTLDKNVNQAFADAAITITLPPNPPDGKYVKLVAVGGNITVAPNSGQTLGGTTAHDTVSQNTANGYTFDGPSKAWISDGLSA